VFELEKWLLSTHLQKLFTRSDNWADFSKFLFNVTILGSTSGTGVGLSVLLLPSLYFASLSVLVVVADLDPNR